MIESIVGLTEFEKPEKGNYARESTSNRIRLALMIFITGMSLGLS